MCRHQKGMIFTSRTLTEHININRAIHRLVRNPFSVVVIMVPAVE